MAKKILQFFLIPAHFLGYAYQNFEAYVPMALLQIGNEKKWTNYPCYMEYSHPYIGMKKELVISILESQVKSGLQIAGVSSVQDVKQWVMDAQVIRGIEDLTARYTFLYGQEINFLIKKEYKSKNRVNYSSNIQTTQAFCDEASKFKDINTCSIELSLPEKIAKSPNVILDFYDLYQKITPTYMQCIYPNIGFCKTPLQYGKTVSALVRNNCLKLQLSSINLLANAAIMLIEKAQGNVSAAFYDAATNSAICLIYKTLQWMRNQISTDDFMAQYNTAKRNYTSDFSHGAIDLYQIVDNRSAKIKAEHDNEWFLTEYFSEE